MSSFVKFNNINRGKLTDRSMNKTDISFYNSFWSKEDNAINSIHGGIFKRSGTEHCSVVEGNRVGIPMQTTDLRSFLIYFLEDNSIQIFETTNKIFTEIANTLSHDIDINDFDYQAIGNSVFVVSPTTFPKQLLYLNGTFSFDDAPLNTVPFVSNESNNTIEISTSGDTITASDDLFNIDDVGGYMLVKAEQSDQTWAYCKITNFNSPTSVTVEWLQTPDSEGTIPTGSTATTYVYRFSVFRGGDNPRKIGYVTGRLCLGGYKNNPSFVSISRANFPLNFLTSDTKSGSVGDGDGIQADILSDGGFSLMYLQQTSYGIDCGTTKGIHTIMSGDESSAITPSTIRVNKTSADNCMDLKPEQIGTLTFFGERNIKSVYSSFVGASGISTENVSKFADDYFKHDIKRMQSFKKEGEYLLTLNSIGDCYICMADITGGSLSWSKIVFNDCDYTKDITIVDNEVFFLNVRNGIYEVERLGDFINEDILQEDYIALDDSILYQEELLFNSCNEDYIIVSDASGLAIGNEYFFTSVLGDDIKTAYKITNIEGTKITFDNLSLSNYNKDYDFGKAYKTGIEIPDLSYLNGRTVDINYNNNFAEKFLVTDGKIEINENIKLWSIQVGTRINLDCEGVNLAMDENTLFNKTVNKIYPIMYRSLGGDIGIVDGDIKQIDYSYLTTAATTYPDIETKSREVSISDSGSIEKRISIKHESAFPFYLTSFYILIEANRED